jgi:hypothetical protein
VRVRGVGGRTERVWEGGRREDERADGERVREGETDGGNRERETRDERDERENGWWWK